MESRKSFRTYYGFLLIKKGDGAVCGRYPVTKKECTLGRDTKCDIRILLEKASGQQCIIKILDDKAYVRDKSIAGSTKVNGKHIGRNDFLMHDSDEIDICGRKFVWEYLKKPQGELHNLSSKKSRTRNDHLSPRATNHFSNQVITPMDNNKLSSTLSKSSTKTPSKTIISLNKTPIIVTTENMSKYSFDELQNSLQNQNSTTTIQSGSKLKKSHLTAPVRNIPLLGDSKITQRKSWIVTNTSNNLSSIGAHNRLSTERLKRDSTPELNSSYHYEDEDVEFDSPDPPGLVLNSEHSINTNNTDIADNNLPVDNQSEVINNQDDNNSQSNEDEINKLSAYEPKPSTSRRDTYSVGEEPIVFEENSTPAPRRSILKCSKTTIPNRSRSKSRMVQFARLPKTDSKIKNTKTRLNSGFNFIVTDDENNVVDFNQSNTNSMQFNVEEYDDDLDGVQPLDSSVSSLLNSPILDNNSINNKSSKRGSRGNKVMSLINSIEKRTNESSKHSIRASDLLSINGSKLLETSPNDDSQINANELQESVSSTRRINLEDIFEAEDSSTITSCNLANETKVQEIEESPVKSVNKMSSSKINVLNITDIEKIPDNVITNDVSENDTESMYTFSSPLILPTIYSNTSTAMDSDSTFVDTEKDFSSTEVIDNQFDTNSKLDKSSNIAENCATSTNELLTKSDKTVIIPSEYELSNTTPHDNIDETQKEHSSYLEKIVDEEICTDEVSTPNNDAESPKPIDVELDPKENDVIELINKSTELNEDEIEKQNDVSKIVEQTLNSKTPSKVVECMSEMFNASVDEHETTHSQHKENLVETYILVGKDNLQNPLDVNELKKVNVEKCNETLREDNVSSAKDLNDSLMDAIEVQLDRMHSQNATSSNSNENKTSSEDSMIDLNKQKLLTSNLVCEVTVTENLTSEINDHHSNNSLNTLTDVQSTEIISNSVSKTKSPEKANLTDNCLTNVDSPNISKLPTRIPVDETNTSKLPSINLSEVTISPKLLKKKVINLEDLRLALGAINSKESIRSKDSKSARSSVPNESNAHKNSQIDSTKNSVEVIGIPSSSDDETDKHLDHSLDKSIGKPQYESTPWNWSKSSKTLFNTTTSIQSNDITKNSFSENKDKRRDESRSRSVTPFADHEVWSQMMKDFNESVKKASIGINSNTRKKKYLFDNKSKSLNDSIIKNNISEIKNKNSTQHPTMSSDITSNESVQFRKSLRNKSSLVKKSIKSKKFQSSYIGNDSEESSNSYKILSRKNNSIDNKTSNEIVQTETIRSAQFGRSLRNKSLQSVKSIRKSMRSKKLQSSDIANDSEESSNNNEILQRKNNSINNKTSNEIVQAETIRSAQFGRSLRNKSSQAVKSIRKSMRSKKLQSSDIANDSEKSSNNNEIMLRKNNSIDNKKNNKTVQADTNCPTKSKTKIPDSSTDSEIEFAPTSESKDNSTTLSSSNTDTYANNITKKLKPNRKNSPKSPLLSSLNLHATVNKNESNKMIKKLDKEQIMVSEDSLSSNEMACSSKSPIVLKNNERELRRRERTNTSSINTRTKIALNTDKVKTTEKSKKNTSSTKKYIIGTNNTTNTLSESGTLKLDKKTKTSIAAKSKSSKVSKTVKTKKSSNLRTNTNSRSKRLLQSKPITTNTEDSSDYESASKTEESIQKPQSVVCPPKSIKEKTQKKDVNVDSKSTLLLTRSRRENIKTSDISLKTRTQSRKHAADISPLSLNVKDQKNDNISKVVANAVSRASNSAEKPSFIIPKQILAVNQCPTNSTSGTTKKTTSLRSNKSSQSKRILPSKSIKTNTKDFSENESSSEIEENSQKPLSGERPPKSIKEKSQKKDIHVDNNLSSLSTRRNLREKIKTPDVLLPPRTQSRKRAADTSPLSQPKAKGKKSNTLSKVASAVCRASNSPKKISPIVRTRNMSKLTVKQVSDSSFPETTTVIKKENTKSIENTRTKKRELNSDNCSFDSAPSASKKIRQVTFRGTESKKSNSSTRTTSKIKTEITNTTTEPNVSLKVKYNKNAEKSISPIQRKTRNAEKSISPIQRKTRKAKQVVPKEKNSTVSPRVLRARDKKK